MTELNLPTSDTTALVEALRQLQAKAGSDSLTETMLVALNDLEDTIEEVFTNCARAVMAHAPADDALMVDYAVAALVTERARLAVDGQLTSRASQAPAKERPHA